MWIDGVLTVVYNHILSLNKQDTRCKRPIFPDWFILRYLIYTSYESYLYKILQSVNEINHVLNNVFIHILPPKQV